MEKLAVSWEIAVKVKATSVRKVLDTVTANYDTKSVPYRFAVRRERTHERERERVPWREFREEFGDSVSAIALTATGI